jgi:histidinol-phosphate/aromatic aminotransferase/cobyric acid decarboxylase-like protein
VPPTPTRTIFPAAFPRAASAIGRGATPALALRPSPYTGQPALNDGATLISRNENPFNVSPEAAERAKATIEATNYYSPNDVAKPAAVLVEKKGVPRICILPTPGCGPVLMLTAWADPKPGVSIVTVALRFFTGALP